MLIHNYDAETGEYLGSRQARVLPMREHLPDEDLSKWQFPAHTTLIAPPPAEQGKARVFVGGAWTVVPDHRGETWWRDHERQETISQLGDPSSLGLLAEQPPPPPPTLADYDAAIQGHIDATAWARGYRDAATCISYLSSTNPTWAAEAAVFAPWRDAIWLYAFEQLALVQGGQRSQPTPAELVADLPAIEWP